MATTHDSPLKDNIEAGKAAGARASAEADVNQLKSDLASLRDDVSALLKNAGAYTRAQSRRGLDEGRRAAGDAQEQVDEARDALVEKIKQNPFAAIAIAAGAGFLIGAANRR